MRTLRVFVSHSFSDDDHRGGLEAFRNAVTRTANEVQRHLSEGVRVDVQFAIDRYGDPLFESVLEEIRAADLLIVDLNGLRPNVLLETGVRIGTESRLTIIADKATFASSLLPTELGHLLVGLYDGPDDLMRVLAVPVQERLELALNAIHHFATRDVWFGEHVDEIHVVCAPEPERSSFARRENPNYLFLDNLEDRDALLEVATLTSRLYPQARLLRHSSTGIAPDVLKGNVVVIGGPGFDEDEGNLVARELIQARKLGIHYSSTPSGECMEFRGERLLPCVHASGRVEKDYGYFARVRNPLNSRAIAILAQGIYTAGTLGASIAFSDSPDALENQQWLYKKLEVTGKAEFEVLLQVDVGPGGVVTPARTRPIKALRLDE